jgi:hypothetical protein
MHTVIVILGGLVLLGALVLAWWWLGGPENASIVIAAKVFIPVWLLAALFNLWVGVSRAGYSVAEELPIFAVVFAVPAAVAGFLWWKFS